MHGQSFHDSFLMHVPPIRGESRKVRRSRQAQPREVGCFCLFLFTCNLRVGGAIMMRLCCYNGDDNIHARLMFKKTNKNKQKNTGTD